jgi:hypothetical protein
MLNRRVLYVTRKYNEVVWGYILKVWLGCLADMSGSIQQVIEYKLLFTIFCVSSIGMTQTLGFGLMWQVFYHCANAADANA